MPVKGSHISEEHKRKIAEGSKKRWAKVREPVKKVEVVVDTSGRSKGDSAKGMLFRLRNPRAWELKAVRSELEEVLLILLSDDEIFCEKDLLSTRNYPSNYYSDWIEKYFGDETIQNIHIKIQDIIESRIKKAVASKKISAQFGTFLLKAQHGYIEKNITETTIKVDEEISDAKQDIMQKLLENIKEEK